MKMSFQKYIAETVTAYASVAPEEVLDIRIHQEEMLFEINFSTEWMTYLCYMDLSGEILGFLSEPVFEHETDNTEPHSSKCGFCA